MPCYYPHFGYYSREKSPSGKRAITFDRRRSLSGVPIMLPCGKCIGCRLSARRQWAIRCMHEKRMHSASSFLTLTYDDAHLPALRSLRLRDLQLFMKALRNRRPQGLRFFACGEYGDGTLRPHYHVLLLNTDFGDMRAARSSGTGELLYKSRELSSLWSHGEALIGEVNGATASYVAGYVLKKVEAEEAERPGVEPEFRVMSRRPGIGNSWFEKFNSEAYTHDSVILEGHEVAVPRYYDIKLASRDCDNADRFFLQDHTKLEFVKRERARKRVKDKADNPIEYTKERSMVKERHAILMSRRFKREV